MKWHFLSGQNFDCSGCTRCCRGWRIRVDEATRQRPELQEQLIESHGAWYTLKNPDGSCTFLSPQGTCSIHQNKPTGCRQFPFRLCKTPDGIFVGASLYCSSVQKNQGRPLSAHSAELQTFADSLPLVGGDPILIYERSWLDWDSYRILEDFLLEGLERDAPVAPLDAALWVLGRITHSGLELTRPEVIHNLLEQSRNSLAPPQQPFAASQRFHACAILAKAEGLAVEDLRSNHSLRFAGLSQGLRLQDLSGSAPPELLTRLLRALVFSKYLLRCQRPLLASTALLSMASRLLGWWCALETLRHPLEPELKALGHCEYHVYTHGAGLDPLLEAASRDFLWVCGSGK